MFYDRLEAQCARCGVRPTPLLARLGLSKGNLANWKRGGMPSTEVLIRLADILGCSVDYLLGRAEAPDHGAVSEMEKTESALSLALLTPEEVAEIRALLRERHSGDLR